MGEFAMIESAVTARGQTTLPKAVREALSLTAGDRVRYTVLDGEVRIRKVLPLSRLYGIVKYDGPPVSLDEMQQAIIASACKS